MTDLPGSGPSLQRLHELFHHPADLRVGLALMMVLAGGICMVPLPVSQFPPMAPPQVQVAAA
jgi:multidrug efflux pump subunit AcrB